MELEHRSTSPSTVVNRKSKSAAALCSKKFNGVRAICLFFFLVIKLFFTFSTYSAES